MNDIELKKETKMKVCYFLNTEEKISPSFLFKTNKKIKKKEIDEREE